jgi:hypothetical protein
MSQQSNIKLRSIAEQVVADPAALGTFADNMTPSIDALLCDGDP